MKYPINHPVRVLAAGFVVLLLLSLSFFWCRWLCDISLAVRMPAGARYIQIRPSGLVPPEIENEPNVVHSVAKAHMRQKSFLGIVDYFEVRKPEGRNSNIYYYHRNEDDEDWMYYDEKIGRIVCHYTYQERLTDKIFRPRKVHLYAGPEGVSETHDKTLGRFTNPIVDAKVNPFFLYDQKLRCFFRINFRERTVTKGPELAKDDIHKPIQIDHIGKNWTQVDLDWLGPRVRVPKEDTREKRLSGEKLEPVGKRDYIFQAGVFLLVLDETGRIDLLDKESLEFARPAGWLRAPETLFPSKKLATPKDLLAYSVIPLSFKTNHEYRGMFMAGVSREGTAMTLAVFNEGGKLIEGASSKAKVYIHNAKGSRFKDIPSSRAVFFRAPWAPALTMAKYILENLHPPLLSLISYAMADSFEASAGHRALFVLPNSFIAIKGRDVSQNMVERFLTALYLIFPSIILSILLAWRVSKDATVVGLSENAKLFWFFTTIAFGLAAYITYRLTRLKIALVTCANCGRLRRPDMDRCHRCGSKWDVPELTPPLWRVIDENNV